MRPKSIFSEPTGMKLHRFCSTSLSERPASWMKALRPSTKEAAGASTPRQGPHVLARRPQSSSTAALAAGMAISNQSEESIGPSVLQQVRVVDAGGAPSSEDQHDDGESNHDLRGGHHHGEERHDLPVEGTVDPAERDQREVGRVEHELDAHEKDDG